MQNKKPSKNKASDLFLFARRRTKVRRVARFVCSTKPKNSIFIKNRTFIGFSTYKSPFIYIVLCGLRFFTAPSFIIYRR